TLDDSVLDVKCSHCGTLGNRAREAKGDPLDYEGSFEEWEARAREAIEKKGGQDGD
ncbi:hypothetical protein LCGC14_1839440, partial [marine sediment metagenome]